ncbi:hypothetical protein C1646_761993 [Rhizophagus diaphanus]|nr:hypothetical protein C1646_761993 [Rhizophagus diaphanus] [Rhizophagus sp. MUCL 43196]
MLKLNNDILYLIFNELQDDKKALYSYLTVNKTWCETIVPILWRNPWNWKHLKGRKLLLKVIISHLSEESRNNLKIQEIDFLTNHYQKPLFNYIRFCRHLDLSSLNRSISITVDNHIDKSAFWKEILNLFINENTRLTHLYVPYQFDHQIHLISGAKLCFSELEFLSCCTCNSDEVLIGLAEICNSVKELELVIGNDNNNHEITKLIKTTKRLFGIRFLANGNSMNDESFCKILEESLIIHANSIRYFKMTKQPATKIISSFVNLNRLELNAIGLKNVTTCLDNLSLPFLQVLKARCIPINILASLIKNTSGYLIEIKIDYASHDEINNRNIIQAIYKKCPKLKYLKLLIRNSNILELENLLINCQCLNRLYIIINNGNYFESDLLNWDYLFEVLTKSSPISLFDFKFCFYKAPKLESLKLFLDNWKNRHSMSLKTIHDSFLDSDMDWNNEHQNLIEKYKAQGIIRNYNHVNFWKIFINSN